MDKEKQNLANTVFEVGTQMVERLGEVKINKKLFPPCTYYDFIEKENGEGLHKFLNYDRRTREMEERGHTLRNVNRNLHYLQSIKTVGELTGNQEMLEKLEICSTVCEGIVIQKIEEIISSGKVKLSEELYENDILMAWKKCENEEKEINVQLDSETSRLCKLVCEDYALGYEKVKNNCEEMLSLKKFENLATPEEMFAKAMDKNLSEQSIVNNEIVPEE